MLTHKYGLISHESRTGGHGEGKEGRILPPRPARGERTEVRGGRRNPHLNPLPLLKGEANSHVRTPPRKYDVISHESRTRGYGEGKDRKDSPASPRSRGED
jgi:hypothetical protein